MNYIRIHVGFPLLIFFQYRAACQTSVWYLYPLALARFFFYSQKDPGFCKPSGKNVRVLAEWDLYSRPFLFLLFFLSLHKLSPLVPTLLVSVAN